MSDWPAQAVLARLGWGRDNAYTIGALQEVTGASRRQIEAAIQQLRLDGKAIASDGSGVWLTADPDELRATYLSLRKRIASQSVTAWAVRSTQRRLQAGQTVQATLFGEAA